jgi:hypothetical protein
VWHGNIHARKWESGGVAFSITKRLQLRHLHNVAGGTVKGAAAAVLNDGLGIGKETLYGAKRIDVTSVMKFLVLLTGILQ